MKDRVAPSVRRCQDSKRQPKKCQWTEPKDPGDLGENSCKEQKCSDHSLGSESLCSDGRTFLKTQGHKSCLSHLLGLVREEESGDIEAVATIMLGG